ncbi:MAG: ATP-binding cassette domain-containing protein [Thermodesulfovibrionales bacterium]|nr:ATP-binding cassette domain-containing protein [Thermodesulfovibrionales bacterium]
MGLRLEASGIHKAYNGNAVLGGCSFSFESGVYALMGTNGCGKSTFLRICALIEDPDMGEVNYYSGALLLEKDIKLRRRITLLLADVGVFNLTVLKNASYGLRIRGMDKNELRQRAESALEFAGLIHKKDHSALTLSSGEARRLGIARAVAVEPEVLFLDEPTAYIDRRNSELIEEMISNMKKETVIIATHDEAQARRLAGRVLSIEGGRLA